jgi:predicted transposase YbfD/YdcC
MPGMRSSSTPKGLHGILDHFSELKDPRVVGRCEYPLETVLVIAMLGVLCGAEGWTDLELFAASKDAWLRTFLTLPEQSPREGVFRRVFSAIRPAAFEACMRSWVQSLALPLDGQVVAFDGKALRGAIARAFGRTALHQVHAWAGAQGLLLAQAAVKGAPEEGEAIRTLLEALDLEDAIVTMDAGNATQATIAAVVEAKADYVVTVKANRKALHDALRTAFDDAQIAATDAKTVFHQTQEQGHGRAEVRQVWAAPASRLGDLAGHWPGLRSIVRIDRTRVLGDGTVEQRTHYFGSSLPPRVRRLGEVIREHWEVENGLHWSLDVQMGEDRCTIRDTQGATNFALVRRIALMLIKRDEEKKKRGVKAKQKAAGWDHRYLLHLLMRGIA